MCGRDTQLFTWKQVHDFAGLGGLLTPTEDPEPNWNRAPTQQGWAIAADAAGEAAMPMRWGLLPPWAKDTRLAYRTINARLEGIAQKPAFRAAWKQRRALIPSSGYYEWMQLDARTKQPYYVRMRDAPVMFYAGLWESRRDDAGNELLTYSIITRDADQTIATLHDRMPLVLPPGVHADWLHGPPERAMEIALSVPPAPLVFHPVSRDVGSPRNNAPHLIEPITPAGGAPA